MSAAACTSPGPRPPATSTPTQLVVSTPFTLPPALPTRTVAPGATGPTSTAGPTHLPSFSKTLFITPLGSATRRPGECSQAAPGNPIDVTVPDNAEMLPGSPFIKTWRLVNASPCTWSAEYSAVWFSGEQFGAQPAVALARPVMPGEEVDISIGMTAPDAPGSYQSNWKLSSDQGELFGIGPVGDAPFWVRIVVVPPAEETARPPSPQPSPPILVSGGVTLKAMEAVDLDTLTITSDAASDLAYDPSGVAGGRLVPLNGALAGSLLADQPDLQACLNASLGPAAVSIDGKSTGRYFCYKTSLGLTGAGRLAVVDEAAQAITLDLVTWNIP